MSYIATGTITKRLECALFQWSSGGGVNTACPLTVVSHTWSTPPVINGTGDGLTLPQGAYMVSAYVYATRTSASHNISFQFYLGGLAIGKAGSSDVYLNGPNVDQADAEFTVSSSETLELRITGIETSIPNLLSDCRIVLWRIDT